jgi:hypothetical protein
LQKERCKCSGLHLFEESMIETKPWFCASTTAQFKAFLIYTNMNIRVKRKTYTTLSNVPIIDANLSAIALGIFAYIMSKPDNWNAHKNEIYKRFAGAMMIKTTKNAIDSAFKELVAAGYVQIETPVQKLPNGQVRFCGKEYVFFETPQIDISRSPEISDVGNSRKSGKLAHLVKTDLIVKTNKILNTDIGENEFSHHTKEEEVLQLKIKKEQPKEKIAQKRKGIEERAIEFKQQLMEVYKEEPDALPSEEWKKFLEYWTEHGQSDKKMRFEKQTSFNIKRRLTTWKNNIKTTHKKENHGKLNEIEYYQNSLQRIASNLAEKRKAKESNGFD